MSTKNFKDCFFPICLNPFNKRLNAKRLGFYGRLLKLIIKKLRGQTENFAFKWF